MQCSSCLKDLLELLILYRELKRLPAHQVDNFYMLMP